MLWEARCYGCIELESKYDESFVVNLQPSPNTAWVSRHDYFNAPSNDEYLASLS